MEEAPDVLAVILTHNAPESLARCLDAVAAQTCPPRAVLVVDNASNPAVRLEDLRSHFPEVYLERSEVNGGPAGGYALGLDRFLGLGNRLAWVLDDDMRPDPTCLERLLVVAGKNLDAAFVFPVSHQVDGSFGAWPSWCAFLVSRRIVDQVGVPMAELFWWAEDTEYLQERIPRAGYPIRVVGDAVVRHDSIRHGHGIPVWKYYYEARNMLYVHLYVKKKVGRYPRNVVKLFGRCLMKEPEGRWVRLQAMGLGLVDGARGRLGIRFPIEPMREQPDGPKGQGLSARS